MTKKAKLVTASLLAMFVYGILVFYFYTPAPHLKQFTPSGYGVYTPIDDNETFVNYIKINQSRIKKALKSSYQHTPLLAKLTQHYSLDTIAKETAPFEILPKTNQHPKKNLGHRVGFIFVHGLGKTARDFKHTAKILHQSFPQSLMRAVLLQGHGTVVGDSLLVHRSEWKRSLEYTIQSMRKDVDEVYIVGYSAGSTLAIERLNRSSSIPIKGLVLFDPGLKAKNSLAIMTVFLRYLFNYDEISKDIYPFLYTSWTYQLSSEFMLLINEIKLEKTHHLPLFMVLSEDDDTIDTKTAIKMFHHNTHEKSRLVYYQSKAPLKEQKRTYVLSLQDHPQIKSKYRYLSLSHRASINPPSDPMFGFDTWYRNCYFYLDQPELHHQCSTTKGLPYGSLLELSKEENQLKPIIRSEFNPFYDETIHHLIQFLKGSLK